MDEFGLRSVHFIVKVVIWDVVWWWTRWWRVRSINAVDEFGFRSVHFIFSIVIWFVVRIFRRRGMCVSLLQSLPQ